MMPNPVVCGLDQSEGAKNAARFAGRLADRLGLELVLVHAVGAPAVLSSWPGAHGAAAYDDGPAHETALRAGTRFLEDLAVSEGLDRARGRCEVGNAADLLGSVAREEQAELVVIGSRGRGLWRSAILGSVSLTVVSSAPCPVVVVPADATLPPSDEAFTTVVCGLDDSEGARGALWVAEVLSTRLGGRLVLVHVAPLPHVHGSSAAPGTEDELRRREIEEAETLLARLAAEEHVASSVGRRVAFGTPGGALADVADEEDASLVVIGSRGRGPLKSAVLGSVSCDLIGSSRCGVVVVPPEAGAARRGAGTRVGVAGSRTPRRLGM